MSKYKELSQLFDKTHKEWMDYGRDMTDFFHTMGNALCSYYECDTDNFKFLVRDPQGNQVVRSTTVGGNVDFIENGFCRIMAVLKVSAGVYPMEDLMLEVHAKKKAKTSEDYIIMLPLDGKELPVVQVGDMLDFTLFLDHLLEVIKEHYDDQLGRYLAGSRARIGFSTQRR